MSCPPLEIENAYLRSDVIKNKIKIFLLYEGQVTENLLINPLTSTQNARYFNKTACFIPITKTENEQGASQPTKLMRLALDFPNTKQAKQAKFKSGRDKILVIFDLDVMLNNQDEMNQILAMKNNDIILGYTNPAIELFLLLFKNHSYEQIIEPNKAKILENNYIDEDNKIRFVYDLVMKTFGKNPKSHHEDFRDILNNIDIAEMQERYLNNKLTRAANNLTSNICYVLKKIKDGKIDEIDY